MISDLRNQFDYGAQRVKAVVFMCALKQIYTKLCTSSISVSKAANPPGYLLPDIKRRSLSSLPDRIPRKKEPCYSCLSGRALLLWGIL